MTVEAAKVAVIVAKECQNLVCKCHFSRPPRLEMIIKKNCRGFGFEEPTLTKSSILLPTTQMN